MGDFHLIYVIWCSPVLHAYVSVLNRLLPKSLFVGSKAFFDPAYQRQDSGPDLSGFAKICWQKVF